MTYKDEFLREQDFPYKNMTIEERELCLKFLNMTKEFKNSNIIQSYFNKVDGKYILNGLASIKNDKDGFEHQTFQSEIVIDSDSIKVISLITRLYGISKRYPNTEKIETFDVFLENEKKLIQKTSYPLKKNKNSKFEYDKLEQLEMFYKLLELNNTKKNKRWINEKYIGLWWSIKCFK